MSSSSRQGQLRLALEIQRNGLPVPAECDNCLLSNRRCIAMPDTGSRLKCSECTRLGRPCVNMSWQSLDKTREEYAKKVEADEALLAEVMTRLLRNKKILKQAEERAKKKTVCLANELRDSGTEVDASSEENCPAAAAEVGLSPALWTIQGFLEDLSAAPQSGDSSVF